MDIAVVIPTHNRLAVLRRALDSVLAQTYPAAETCVVDDGSSDGTAACLAADYPWVRVVCQPNRGVSAARNAGVAATSSPWVALLDSDDEWLADKLQRQVAALRESAGYRIAHCDEIWLRRGRRVNPRRKHRKRGGQIFAHCLPLCCISPSAVVLRRDLLAEHGGFDETLPACEDYALWLRVCARERVLYLAEKLLRKHGGHGDQLSARYWGMDRFRVRAISGLLDEGVLDPEQSRLALETLKAKCHILATGARKRGNHALVTEVAAILAHHGQA